MPDSGQQKCSGCGAPLDAHNEGVELWGSRFCSTCFIANSSKLHKELTEEDKVLLRTIGRELSGYLPPELLEMVALGFYRRVTGRADAPAPAELERFCGEIQRLSAFSTMRKILNLLKTWKEGFDEFVEQQETEIREVVKRLTET